MKDPAMTDDDTAPGGPLVRCGRSIGWWTAPIVWVLAGAFLLTTAFPSNARTTAGGWGSLGSWIGVHPGEPGDPFPTGRAVYVGFGGADRTLPGDAEKTGFCVGPAELNVSAWPAYDDMRGAMMFGRHPVPTGPGPGRWKVSLFLGPLFLLGVAVAWAALRWGFAAVRGDRTPWTRPAPLWRRLARPWVLTAAALAAAELGLTNRTDFGAERVGFRVTPPTSDAVLTTADVTSNWPGRRSVQFAAYRPAAGSAAQMWSWTQIADDAAPARSAGSRGGSWFLGRYETPRGRAVVAAVSVWWLAVPPACASAIVAWRAWRRRRRAK